MKRNFQATEPPEGIEKLSTELLIQIFSYISPRDRLACSLVSKRWFSCSRAWEFNGALQISSPSDKETIPALFKGRNFPFKKIIFVRHISCLWRKEWKAFWKFVKPHISEIVFGVCVYPALTNKVFEKVLPMLPQLQKLTLLQHKIKLPNFGTKAIVLNSLRELDLSKTSVPNAVLTYLVNCCPALELLEVGPATFKRSSTAETFKTLRTLYWVPTIKFHEFDVNFYKDQLPDLDSLSNVVCTGIVIEDEEIGDHLGLFAAFQSRLDYVEVRKDSYRRMKKKLFKFFIDMECVKAIKMYDCSINVHSTFKHFSQIKGLKRLELEKVSFGPTVKVTKYTFPELEHLSFRLNQQSYYVTKLNKLRLNCPRLRTLSIPKFDLGLIDAFPHLEHLEITFTSQLNLSDFYILRHHERLTHLTIYHLDSLKSSDWEYFHFKALKCFKILRGRCSIRVNDIRDLVERNSTIQEIHIGTSEKAQLNEQSLMNTFGQDWNVDVQETEINREIVREYFFAKLERQIDWTQVNY